LEYWLDVDMRAGADRRAGPDSPGTQVNCVFTQQGYLPRFLDEVNEPGLRMNPFDDCSAELIFVY
jgi:hypothetical protein